jgi:dTDP-glucose pyrophosphorylase
MIYDYKKHLISDLATLKEALQRLNDLGLDAILFVVDELGRLRGSLTDGDVRRGLINNLSLETSVNQFIQPNPRSIQRGHYTLDTIIELREKGFKVLPVNDSRGCVINVINFRYIKSYLPVDAVIMAGGRGQRLSPLTDTVPKPLLKVGGAPIIEHNLKRLLLFGIDDFWISVNYLGNQIEDFFGDGADRSINIKYVTEDKPLGTIGSVSNIHDFQHDYVLIINSDILTNLDYEHFFIEFLKQDADLAVVTIPYNVNVPYAVLETNDFGAVTNFKEKPTYTYYSNGGIYLLKRSILALLPKGEFFNATDLMQALIAGGGKVFSYPMIGYWLDIGSPEDYKRAQSDIEHIKF